MANARTPRSSWVEAGLLALADGGPDAVRVEQLARALGVTKGGFYWYFNDRSALLEEMLEAWERAAIDDVIDAIDSEGGDGRVKLWKLYEIATSSADVLRIDLAVRDWARRDEKVADRLRRADNRRMDYMRSLFGQYLTDPDEVEARCLIAFSLWIGNHFIAADHGGKRRAEVLETALRQLEP